MSTKAKRKKYDRLFYGAGAIGYAFAFARFEGFWLGVTVVMYAIWMASLIAEATKAEKGVKITINENGAKGNAVK